MAQISLSCSPRSSASTRSKEVLRQISGIRKEGWGGVGGGGGCPLLLNVEEKLKGIWKFHPSLRQTHLGKTTPWSSSQGKPNGGTPCPRRREELGKMCKNMYIYIVYLGNNGASTCSKLLAEPLKPGIGRCFAQNPRNPLLMCGKDGCHYPQKKGRHQDFSHLTPELQAYGTHGQHDPVSWHPSTPDSSYCDGNAPVRHMPVAGVPVACVKRAAL